MALEDFYAGLDASTRPMVELQPWWPCLDCPVLGQPDNCCNYAMFLITRTEWEYLREHPFIRAHVKRLSKDARRSIHRLRGAGHDVNDWAALCRRFGDEHDPLPFHCPLLGADGLCQVYDRRPTICRAYGMSRHVTGDGFYGCQVVSRVITEHGAAKALPLEPILTTLADLAEGPVKPIVAWLAGVKP